MSEKAASQQRYQEAAIKLKEAIGVAKLLPEPICTIEVVHLSIHLSNTHTSLSNITDADAVISDSLKLAEKFFLVAPVEYTTHARELLLSSCLSKMQCTLNALEFHKNNDTGILILDKLETVLELGKQAEELTTTLFGVHDVMHFKPLRLLALANDSLGKNAEAEELLHKAHLLLCKSSDLVHVELQQFVCKELLKMVMRRQDMKKALAHAVEDYDGLIRKGVDTNHLVMSDSCVRRAQLQMCIQGLIRDSESNLLQALDIRQAKLGSESLPVADVLVMISKVREACDIIDESLNESLLIRAQSIYNAYHDVPKSLPFYFLNNSARYCEN